MTVFYIFKIYDPDHPNLVEALNLAYDDKTKSIEFWQLFKMLANGSSAKEPHMSGVGKLLGNKCELSTGYISRETRNPVITHRFTLNLDKPLNQLTEGARGKLYQTGIVTPRQAEFMYKKNYPESGLKFYIRHAA